MDSIKALANLSGPQIDAMLANKNVPEELKKELRKLGQLNKALDLIITSHDGMNRLKEKIRLLALRQEPVLILGETGTGKGAIAKALHGNRGGRFIRINCSSLPGELIESELFGHCRGAFTGAINERVGKFIAAKNGTIFLDEIGDMPLDMQAKLLIALQDKVVTPLGSNEEQKIENTRVIAATNKKLTNQIKGDRFREDLYYRLSMFEIKTIPLRERVCDIHEAMDALYDTEHKIPPEIREKIATLPLTGNYRELEKICLHYIVFGEFNTQGEYLV